MMTTRKIRGHCVGVLTLLALGSLCSNVPNAPAKPPAAPSVPVERDCGEAGPRATPLPPALFDGMRSVGDGSVSPGQKVRVGNVEVDYQTDAWIGTLEAGYRGSAIHLLIDRDEAGPNLPWGGQVQLGPKLVHRAFIGPYRINLTGSAEDPPQKVAIHVDKRACPDHAIIPPPPGPIWMWTSTEAIRLFTVDMNDQMLQVMIDARDTGPRAEIRTLSWSQSLFPRPGRTQTVRIDGRSVTIEAVEPGRGTRYDADGWHADQGMPRASMRVRVDPAPVLPMPVARGPAAPCGVATTDRTAQPSELAIAPRSVGEVTIAAGEKRMLDGIELTGDAQEIPARPGPGQKPQRSLMISSGALVPSSVSFGSGAYPPGPSRAERAVVLFEAAGPASPPPQVLARAYRLACPRTLALPAPTATQFVWLSTIGLSDVTLGPPGKPVLRLQLQPDSRDASLLTTGDDVYESRRIEPSMVGHTATFNALRILVTDVIIAPSKAPFPITHVQVRIDHP